jgi:hypothetical protein
VQKRRTRAQVRAIVERFQRSGLSQRAFAERLDLSQNTLAFWIARERRASQAVGALVPISRPQSPASGFELEVPGAVIRVPRDATAEEWRALREAWTA